MNSRHGIGGMIPKLATIALAMRLATPIGFACELNDCHEPAAGHHEHGEAAAAHHSHDAAPEHHEASGHGCHDTEDNCTCSLTFIPEVQPSRSPESLEVPASSMAAVMPHTSPVLEVEFDTHCHLSEIFHPPRSVGIESIDSPRGPPSVV
jgi:hypothetical protein